LAKEGIAFEALDNGILSCADPKRLQQICDGLSAAKIDALLRKWLPLLPHPFTAADRRAGYRYDISILQAEFSLTQVLDRPQHGRLFFEQVIRENLDLGRPEQMQLIFRRRVQRNTPGLFRTRILTRDVTPSLHVYYKNTRIKQYHKESRALRTKTTINNARDFGVGKRLCNLPALRAIGFAANRRLLEVERSATTACSPSTPYRRSTIPSPQAASAPRACALPIRACTRSCRHWSCSGSFRTASAQPICATILRSCPLAPTQAISQGAAPTSCAASVCTVSSSGYPTASAIAPPRPACASPCSSGAPTTVSSALAWRRRCPASAPSPLRSSAPSTTSMPR
jgi:hypothetical protein